jgi:hypothetical protein
MIDKPRDIDVLHRAGTIIRGAGKILMVDDGRVVGFCYPTSNMASFTSSTTLVSE